MEDYQRREKNIINWAKNHYQSYKDIQTCANELNIRTGAVYLTLKQHNFIKQTETTEYRVMSAYFKYNGRLAEIVEETGLTVWIVAKTIENLGYSPRWQEYRESRYVSRKTNLGAGAEAKFKSLVPQAVDMNEEYKECNRDFDFIVNEKTVDVKEYTKISPKSRANIHWEFKCYGEHPDFYCLFLCHDKEKRINGEFDILLIPSAVIPIGQKVINININPNTDSHRYWYQFQVDPHSLAYMLGGEI